MSETNQDQTVVELAAELVSAYVSRNSVPMSELPSLIQAVHKSLGGLNGAAKQEPVAEPQKPAVSIKKSVAEEALICLEDGQRFKSLKRHLTSAHGMTPQAYRAKWGLRDDYPMVAPAYANERSTLARSMGLGRKPNAQPAETSSVQSPDPEPEPRPTPASTKTRRRGRAKAAA